ncbi:MAG: hypothetical protein IH623_02605 [Verrucomicrobia bacterium]|nr:hypothetical protein [Verrucomicrobiota bacterium]
MNTKAVHESVRLLPENSAAYRPNPPIRGRKSAKQPLAAQTRWAEATNDPQWAWRIAQGYHWSQEPLPASIHDQNFRRAYHYLRGARDEQIAVALGIRTSSQYGTTRSVLQGLLCARDISIEDVASLLGLEVEVVMLYEGLFFNVRNREATFALNAIFPQTRLGAVVEAEKDYNEVDLMLMRLGRDYGWREIARFAGLITMEEPGESTDTMLTDMERTIAANARMLARAGHLNRKDSPGIRQAKALMMRAKKEAELNAHDDPDSRVGLGSFGMKVPVLAHFKRMSEADIDYRLALQRQEVMREQDADAGRMG